ncbi:hypothetical protein ASE28_01510 [Acidovorax sp. Root219]|nr:hypothetical protein ASE28_01510 [Acidovorax sp. Root219]
MFSVADDLKLRAPQPAPAPEAAPAPAAAAVAAKAPARREVPGMTVGSVLQDTTAGVLQVGGTAVKGLADLARFATGDAVGKDLSDSMEERLGVIRSMVGSDRAAAQRENFQRDMADPNVGIKDALLNNKGALADQVLPTLGSMLLPVGAAGLAGKAATAGKAAAALDTAALASRVATAQKAAGISATAAQNAADVFAGLVDKGVPMEDAYKAAGITVPFSVIAGKLTGGGAEVALARQAAGQVVKGGAMGVAKGAAREGLQEVGEELGQVTGEAVGTGETPNFTNAGKRLAVAGTLGAVVGGGVDVAGNFGAPRVEDQSTTPKAPPVPPAPRADRVEPAGEGEISIASAVDMARSELGGPGQPAAPGQAPAQAATVAPAAPAVDAQPATGPLSPQQKQEIARARTQALLDAEPGAAPQVQTEPATTQADVQRLATEARAARDADETRQIEAMVAADEQSAQGRAAATAQASSAETQQGQADTLAVKARQRVLDDLTASYGEANGYAASRTLPAIDRQLQTLGQAPLTAAERERTAELLGRAQAFVAPNLPSENTPAVTVPDRGADNSSLEAQIKERAEPQPSPAPPPPVEMVDLPSGQVELRGDAKAVRAHLVASGVPAGAIRGAPKGVIVSKTVATQARHAFRLPAAPAPAPAVTAPEAANARQAQASQPTATPGAGTAPAIARSDAAVPAAPVPGARARTTDVADIAFARASGPATSRAPVPSSTAGRLGLDNVPLDGGGKPFATRNAAAAAKKLQPTMRVVAVDGGYALAEKTPAQLAAQANAAKRLRNPNTSAKGAPIPAHAFIAAEGGMNQAARADLGVEGNPRVGNRTLYAGKGKGLTIEQATEKLVAQGYLQRGASNNDALALVKRSLSQPQYTPEGWERVAQAEESARFEDFLAMQEEAEWNGEPDPFDQATAFTAEDYDASGFSDADPALQAEVNALLAMLEAKGLDAAEVLTDIVRDHANSSQDAYNRAAQARLEEAIASRSEDRGGDAAESSRAGAPGRSGSAAAQDLTGQPGSDLLGDTPNTNQQAAHDERLRRAEQEREQRNAAPGPEGFELGSQDINTGREADRRQGGLDLYGTDDSQYSREMAPDLSAAILRATGTATIESVQAAVEQLVGSNGRLPGGLGSVVVATSSQIKADWEPLIGPVAMGAEQGGRAAGFYDPLSRTVFLIADHIKAGQEVAVAAHELMHKHGQAVLGKKGWDLLHDTIGGWATAAEGSLERQVYDEAAARVQSSRPAGADAGKYSTQELFPYALQVATEMGITPTAMRPITTVQGWMARVRHAIQQVFGKLMSNPEAFAAQDLVDLGFAIAQRENPDHAGELDGAADAGDQIAGDVQYSRDGEAVDFAAEVRAAITAGVKDDRDALRVQVPLGIETPAVLQMLGVARKPVFTNRDLIAKMHIEHGVPRADLNNLGSLMANPVLVFKSDTQPGRFTMVTSLVVSGKPVVVAVEPNGRQGRAEVVYVPTAYPKDNADAAISGWLSKGLLLYAHKEESRQLATTARLQLPGVVRRAVGFRANYKTEADLPSSGEAGPMFSRAAPPAAQGQPATAAGATPARSPLPAETGFRKVQRVMQDKLNRITVLSNWARDNGIQLSSEADVWGYEARMHGTVATRVEDFREGTVKPVIDRIQKAGFTTEQVAEYLHAAHAEERNAQIESIDPKIQNGSGMTNAEAQAILAKAPQGLAALATEVQAITDSTRQILLDAGIISQEMADAWGAAYKNYVPLKGGDEAKKGGVGKGLSVDGRQKRALGHGARDEKIIENILRDHERAIMLAEKNKVGQAMLVLVDELNNPDIATINQPERRRVLKQGTMYEVRTPDGIVVDTFTTSNQALQFVGANPGMKLQVKPVKADPMVVSMATPMLQPNEAQVYVKGHAVRVQLNDEGLARAYKHMGVESLTTLMKVNREINGALSKAYTAYNPEFLLKNIARDFTAGLAITTAKYGAGVSARAVKNYPMAMAKLIRYGFTGKATGSVAQYRLSGGSTGAAYLGDLARIGEDVQATFDDARGAFATARGDGTVRGVRTAMRKSIKSGLKLIEVLNGAGESAMRLSVFEAMQQEGNDLRASASAAKELLNFNRNGEATRTVGGWYLFLNASIQGTAALADAMVHGKHREQGWAMVAGMAGLFYALAQAQFGGDDEDKKAWERISPDVKAKNLIIRTGADSYITLPMPYGLGAFFGIGNAAHDLQQGKDVDKVALDLALLFADQFLPVKPYADGGDTRGLVELVPGVAGGELMRAALRAGVNRSGLGGDIVPDSKFDESRPEHLRAYRSTRTSVYQTIADQLNAASGGTQTQAGLVDVSPETLKYWTRTLTGGAGVFAADLAGLLRLGKEHYDSPDDPDRAALMPDLSEMPIARGFAREDRIGDDRRQYWTAAKGVRRADQDRDRAKKMGDEVGWERVEEQRGELLGLVKMMERSSKHIKEIRDEVEEIMLDDSTSMAFKRAQVKKLEAEESGIYREFIDAVAEDQAEAGK